MKKIVTGGFLSLIGTLWTMVIAFYVGNNLTSAWGTPPGRILTTVMELHLHLPLAISLAMIVWGIVMMLLACYGKES